MAKYLFPNSVEQQKWQDRWFNSDVYHWCDQEKRENSYVIDTPPPTVSGLLHMGHVFSYTQTDFIARFRRMWGDNVFYPIGFDDNGLPTERLVEKVKGVRAVDMSRQAFIAICQEVVQECEEEFRVLFKSLGLSIDWRQEYQTINESCRRLSQMSFLDLLGKKKAERRLGPTFWDPVDQTAIAQAEMEDKEKAGVMYYINFPSDCGEGLTIATTRPEMLPACVAVFVHPDDIRYTHLHGTTLIIPIFGQKVRVIADADVDPEKGSGAVMCCTFGDIQDIQWWRRHQLAHVDLLDKRGRLQNSHSSYDGMFVKDARKKIVGDLSSAGFMVKQQEVTQYVKCAERSGAPLEIISTYQWYINVLDSKEEIIAKARTCNWMPEYMLKRLEIWTEGLNQDWCISRQRYFGVPFPVWYSKRPGEEGKVLLPTIEQLPVDPLVDLPAGYTREEVTPDIDVMDTWATSSISPQLNSHAINAEYAIDSVRHQKLYPADLRPQAHEIIRTWAFYTIVKSLLHSDTIPWKNLTISGWCLASDKTKMSKSKGNVITPNALILEQGADIVRYWASTSKLGVDICYNEEAFKIGKKLVNKLWNASKFVAMHLEKLPSLPLDTAMVTHPLDLWLLSKLRLAVEKATDAFLSYEYADARSYVEEFFWNDFCDNYLELAKNRLYNSNDLSAPHTLYWALKVVLSLFSPFIPHTTEEIYQVIYAAELNNANAVNSIHQRGNWPKVAHLPQVDLQEGENAKYLLELIRKYKSLNNLSLKAELGFVVYNGPTISDIIIADLLTCGNISSLEKGECTKSPITAENNPYQLMVRESK